MLLMVLGASYSVAPSLVFAGEIPQLDITKGKGDSCLADKDFMRLNHMDLLQHDRDLTMHKGDRSIKYSLKKCVACHAVNGDDGQPVSVADPKHFCKSCHNYAAVTIDCFQCHASKPDVAASKLSNKEINEVHKKAKTKVMENSQ